MSPWRIFNTILRKVPGAHHAVRKLAGRLKDYLGLKGIKPGERIFSITCSAARVISKKAGLLVGVQLRPHDLRRHAATYASRSGIPIEIVSKVILPAALQFGYDPEIPWEDPGY
jgi:hypothetical protein